jgi:hypothetical protein
VDFDVVFGVVGGCSAVITAIGAFGKLHHQLLQNDLDKQWCCNNDKHWLLQTTFPCKHATHVFPMLTQSFTQVRLLQSLQLSWARMVRASAGRTAWQT